jgi:DNA replication protein DnaC
MGAARVMQYESEPPIRWHLDMPLDDVKRELWRAICEAVYEKGGGAVGALPQYAQVAEWLADNEGKGLMLYGNCGLGKTLIARQVLPKLIAKFHDRHYLSGMVDAYEMDERLYDLRNRRIVSIDDVGAEAINAFKDMAFGLIVDSIEKRNGLLIMTSNLTGPQMYERYGERVCDRLKVLCRKIEFKGESFRK